MSVCNLVQFDWIERNSWALAEVRALLSAILVDNILSYLIINVYGWLKRHSFLWYTKYNIKQKHNICHRCFMWQSLQGHESVSLLISNRVITLSWVWHVVGQGLGRLMNMLKSSAKVLVTSSHVYLWKLFKIWLLHIHQTDVRPKFHLLIKPSGHSD